MYKNILALLIGLTYINSQRCLRPSPNNPIGADCSRGGFDLDKRPSDNCLCCTPTDAAEDRSNECLNAKVPTPIKREFEGQLICRDNFDCCTCSRLQCENCTQALCAGDSSCIGVNIDMDGRCDLAGAALKCNGDISCYRTKIKGECVTSIDCNGDNSCAESLIEINMKKDVPDKLQAIQFIFNGDDSVPKSIIKAKNVGSFVCGGDLSCYMTNIDIECKVNDVKTMKIGHGCNIDVGGDNSAPKSIWKATGVNTLSCKGDGACEKSTFNVDCIEKGCPATFTGDNSAPKLRLNVNNCNTLACAGDDSCGNSKFNVNCTDYAGKGCPVTVTGEHAAQYADWKIVGSNLFTCVGKNGCVGGTFNLDCAKSGCPISLSGSGQDAIIIVKQSKGVICNGGIIDAYGAVTGGSCENAIFKLDNNKPSSIMCGGVKSCYNARFSNSLGGPIKNIESVSCTADKSCFGMDLNIVTTDKSFMVNCNSVQSCRNAKYTLEPESRNFGGINCGSTDACKGAFYDIKKYLNSKLRVAGISCSSKTACEDTTIDISSNKGVIIDKISCSGPKSCLRTNINIFIGEGKFEAAVSCGGMDSCDDLNIIVKRFDGSLVNPKDIRLAISGCHNEENCDGAVINSIEFVDYDEYIGEIETTI